MNSLCAKFIQIFNNSTRPLIFGMIHIPSLPGTPANTSLPKEIINFVSQEVQIYKKCNVDGIILENMNDIPYLHSSKIGPEIVAMMTACAAETLNVLSDDRKNFLLGIQVLAGGNKEAISIAHSTGFDFIRAESFVYSHVADEGIMNSCAGELLRFRKHIGANDVAIITDIKKKHCSHAITSDLTVGDIAEGADFFRADGVILTGTSTGKETNVTDIDLVKKSCKLPLFIGSGITIDNMKNYRKADGFIVGSHFKVNGNWRNKLCEDKISKFVNMAKQLTK
ncbi:Photosystem I BtpA, assembly family and Ribulose-phosphate binding barrel domain and Aldolase-type TIM barrel domain-containing protein [Strongyloides ratti]|uniref:Photosystem I BtpA, assembly family and Ribulose-phosphate binding barrel domain and Aldolase-type TIM barrel domain-containing protein n=1 Tax=Strongyloides ratti TaxID=34506 RepID=A0A090KUM2_STRRB|nr:Photosystem I BtpA, assembly family and Ribulose-phosphate binding barrel domain and Aldolase-type TIM barrel domain-containing protein [Strongyloides ratti]CEF61116.1 Photosystem I BtpA, assembly family and Ribulose-phosphate binding barrel domain and Aldolase-type TIM barrel domain-containing protein [Strongyloides ratti]